MPQRVTPIAALVVAGLVWIGLAIAAAGGNHEVRPSIVAGGLFAKVAQRTSELEQALHGVIKAAPTIRDEVWSSASAALSPTPGGRTPAQQLTLVLVTILVLVLIPMLVRWQVRRHLPSTTGDAGESPVFWLLLRDTLSIAAVGALGFVAVRVLFPTEAPLDRLAVGLIWGFIRWWTALQIVDIVLRPEVPQARLVPAGDAAARTTARLLAFGFGLGILFIAIAPVLLGGGLQAPSARVLAIVIGLAEGLLLLLAVRVLFRAEPRPPRWLGITLRTAITASVAIWLVSVLALEFSAYHSFVLCLEAVGVAYILDRLLVVGARSLVPEYATAVRRVIWLATGVVVLFGLAKLSLVKVFDAVAPDTWLIAERGYAKAFVIVVIGFTIYEGMKAIAAVHFGADQTVPGPGDEQLGKAVSRFATVVPIAIGFGGTIIVVTSLILALSELGVSVGPLIAGASIVGLAFSFGAQALVRDIVSGMFYMVDDAFRIGEYIDTGRHKGTVERISLRSVRLRHQNGQFHNVPYGQFGAVTNYSRDWTTLKFNLRVARTVDVERARKLTKVLGQQLLEHPELGPEFLLPLKLQGLVDIQENALVLRFKFTVKPNEPTIVRREIIKRLFQMFNENGIAFASHSVTVHASEGSRVEDAGAAAAQIIAPSP